MKEGKDISVKEGDQSKKIEHRGSRLDQGDTVCGPDNFGKLTGPEGAMDMSPKVKAQPSRGPFDSPKGKQAGQSQSKQDSGDKNSQLTPVRNPKK